MKFNDLINGEYFIHDNGIDGWHNRVLAKTSQSTAIDKKSPNKIVSLSNDAVIIKLKDQAKGVVIDEVVYLDGKYIPKEYILKKDASFLEFTDKPPPNPKEGQSYYDTIEKGIKLYQDGMWATLKEHNLAELIARKLTRMLKENK